MNVKDAAKLNFSRYAAYYDEYSDVQDKLAVDLISSLDSERFENILDIGCGTGNYTQLLRNEFPKAAIKAVDICDRMIEVAQNKLKNLKIEFIIDDAETMVLSESFDLVTSNACFQWFDNLQDSLAKYKNLLRENGTILFSAFGPLTFNELAKLLNMQITSETFLDADKLSKILNNNFSCVSVNQLLFKKSYASLFELLKTIKYTGTRGIGLNGKNFSKDQITKLEKIYKKQFNDIIATYQIFYCRAKKEGKK